MCLFYAQLAQILILLSDDVEEKPRPEINSLPVVHLRACGLKTETDSIFANLKDFYLIVLPESRLESLAEL